MKQFLFVLLCMLLVNIPAFSQLGTFIQRGGATQEMNAEGLCAAHNNIPLNSTITITNTVSGKEIEVVVTGRILMSSQRIVDLSSDAWAALELTPDTIVMINYVPVLPPTLELPPPERRTFFPIDIAEFDEDFLEWLLVLIAKPQDITALSSLPDPDCDKVYRLQVGSYRQTVNADRAERLLNAMGFTVGRETFNEFTRVFVVDIPAKEVQSVMYRLGVVGFRSILVRESF